ncbi:MAG: CDP-diacylglycerol--glycerol-3-phosphate 3-phosphatidyltransferase [Polyangia bacterium]|nr:CDP-diacylglycerol--glycerol-3-phosphate 3-phosphatidyltransferase [Polyangia bacterium]
MEARKPRRRQTIKEEFTNLPNVISLVRIAAIPLVLWFIDDSDPYRSLYACVLFLAAALSDAIDGYLARKRNQITVVGKFLDPLADKLLVMAVLVYMVRIGRVEEWLAVLLIGREIAITGLRGIAVSEGLVIAASRFGKNKTAFQLVGISFLIIHFPYPLLLTNIVIDFHVVGIYVLYVSLALSIFSAVHYFLFFLEAAEAKRASGEEPPSEP